MDVGASLLATIGTQLLGWGVVFLLLTALEVFFPHGPQPLRARLLGLCFWALFVPVTTVAVMAQQMLWRWLGIEPLLTLPIFAVVGGLGIVGAVVGLLLSSIVHDFFFYWFHRAQHRFLWKYHAVHHSIEDLSAINSYHHISEVLMSLILLTIPTTLIVADAGTVLPFTGLFLWLQIVYIHSPTRLHLGPLRCILVDNRFHRIHHSVEQRHFDRNFGAFTTLWDRVFGTLHMPAPAEWPAVGIAEAGQPRSVREWLDLPARYSAAQSPVRMRSTSCLTVGTKPFE